MLQYLAQIASWVPVVAAMIGALVGVCTALQACFLILSPFWPFAGKVAGELGVIAVDLKGLAGWIGKLAGFFGKGPKASKAGPTLLVLIVCSMTPGCAWLGSPQGQATMCTVTSDALSVLEELATLPGVLMAALQAAFTTACDQALARGMSEADAEKYALDMARAEAARLTLKHRAAHPDAVCK